MVDPATCYMCEKVATTTEHAPPQCFFPETKDVGIDLRVGLITVPSCDEHNTWKSKDDEYAMILVVTHFETNLLARNQFSSKCMRALERSAAFRDRVFHQPRGARIGRQDTLVVDVERQSFDRVMESTCRALFYHERQRKLLDPLHVWSLAFRHPSLGPDADEAGRAHMVRLGLLNQLKRGRNPEAFWYQIGEDSSGSTGFRLMFYEGFSVYAVATHEEPSPAGGQ